MKRFLMRLFVIATCMFCITISTAFALPTGYTELEYLESTGGQYINTGIYPTNQTAIKTKFINKISNDATTRIVIGNQYSESYYHGESTYLLSITAVTRSFCVIGDRWITLTNYWKKGNIYEVEMSVDKGLIINGETTSFPSGTGNFTGSATLKLFGLPNIPARRALVYMYYTKIWQNDVLVRDFIPARRDGDGVLGMYDTVTNTFFTNAGTGTFVAGPIAPNTKIATSSYVMGSYEYVDSTKQDVLTPSHITVTGASDGLMTSVTANNGHITVTKAEVSIPYYHDGTVTRLPIRVQ